MVENLKFLKKYLLMDQRNIGKNGERIKIV